MFATKRLNTKMANLSLAGRNEQSRQKFPKSKTPEKI